MTSYPTKRAYYTRHDRPDSPQTAITKGAHIADGNGTAGAKSRDKLIVGDTGTDDEGSTDNEWVNIDSDTGSDPKAKNYARIDDSNITDPTSDEETDDITLNPRKAKELCLVKAKMEEKVESTEALKAEGTRTSCVRGLFH